MFTWRKCKNKLEVEGVQLGEEKDKDDAKYCQPSLKG